MGWLEGGAPALIFVFEVMRFWEPAPINPLYLVTNFEARIFDSHRQTVVCP